MPDRILARRLELADGTELRTVRDATVVIERAPQSIISENALALLRRAAETGTRSDIRAATDTLIGTLRHLAALGPIDQRRR